MPTVNLTPLGLGELLDQTFSTFRKHFWLFAGIMVIPQSLMVALNIMIQVTLNPAMFPQAQKDPHAATQAAETAMRAGLASFAILIPYFVVYTLALGASTYALSEIYLGRTITIRESYRAVRRKLGTLLNVFFSISLRTFGLVILLFILMGMMVAGVAPIAKFMPWVAIVVGLIAILGMLAAAALVIIFLVRYSVAVPAAVLERLNARQALKRSVVLTKGYLWRLLIVGFLMWMITMTLVTLCQSPFTVATVLMSIKGGQPSLWLTVPSLLIGGAASVATAPLFMISFAIAYYDLRVRKEGFDLQLMMSNLDQTGTPGASVAGQTTDQSGLQDGSVLGVVILTFLTGGIYQPIWFLLRRKAFNRLNSPEKLGAAGLTVALLAFVANFAIPIAGSFAWGSSVQAENILGPVHPAILLIGGIIMVVSCFKVRRILLDHLAPQQEGMFSASIRFQYDDAFSRMGTFFLGIYYLQYKINGLLDRLASEPSGTQETMPLAAAEPIPPPMTT
jgi:hypothetical protein